jgi:hypothetical protein
MLSSLSSLADRNFVIAYLLPVILAAIFLLFGFRDVPSVDAIWLTVLDAEKFAALTLFVLTLWVAAVALTFLNLPFYRILEGHYGPFNNRLTIWFLNRHYTSEQKALDDQYSNIGGDDDRNKAYARNLRIFRAHYPRDVKLLQPTQLGNVLKSAEGYAKQVYGADSVAIWARFAAVIPESFAQIVDRARADMDFFVNAVWLSFLASGIVTVHFLKGLADAVSSGKLDGFHWVPALIPVLGFASCWVWYKCAIVKAQDWGEIYRSAFDLYLPDLAKQLGYELPKTADERKTFWGRVNALCLDGTEIKPEDLAGGKEGGEPKPGEVDVIVRGRAASP